MKVALPTPLRRVFDYLPPAGLDDPALQLWSPGIRVLVPFGHQSLIGIVLGVKDDSHLATEKLKPIKEVLDTEACMSGEILALCQWAASYYQHPIGEALSTSLPTLLRQGEAPELQTETVWTLTTEGKGLPRDALKRSPKQALLFQALLDSDQLSREEIKHLDISTTSIKQLENKALIQRTQRQIELTPREQSKDESILKNNPLTLNEEQENALEQLRFNAYNAYLLEGATGSGKTEVYLQAIEKVLKNGRRALILVPEIGLTPQLMERFEHRFNAKIVALHSGLNDKERLQAWLEASKGIAQIIIGTRSSVFTPIPDLGIIIVDEEHDLSFKQQDGFRYSARDLAIVRAQRSGIPLILGTATPSLETLYNSIHNRYLHLRLTQRAGDAKPPSIELISLRGAPLVDGFTGQLITEIKTELELGNQVLVFINRRGFAPTLICHECGWIAECNHCSARLTIHKHPAHLRCHHCDHQRPLASKCPSCSSSNLESLGQGTERSEAALQNVFPNTPIIRVDRDTTRRKNSLADMVSQIHQGEPCILVGTQMLAKGHHFPNVTLAALIDIDSGLFSGDFRGPERMGQLLIQVAGRAGRAQKPGRVIIQSHHCEHPNIQSLIKEGYHRYARRLLHERQVTNLPPYRHMGLLRSESKRPENAVAFLKLARQISQQMFPASQQLSYLGPLPALMERKKDRFCFQLHISSESRKMLHTVLLHLGQEMENNALARRVRWSIDVDPQDMS
ncbi:primosomal protein N' [Aurantivibrio infirmus]